MSLQSLLRILVTLVLLTIALLLAHWLWRDYMYSPWTRDGRVRADVVQIAPDVSGLVSLVHVKDNQAVRRGDPLFTIDPTRFQDALAEAAADVDHAQAQRGLASAQSAQRASEHRMRRAQADRRAALGQLVISAEVQADYAAQADQAMSGYQASRSAQRASDASYQAALAARAVARRNLERSVVRAPVDGVITNLSLRPGDYASAGTPRMAMVDSASFWVYGYFEETKLSRIHPGDRASIRLMSGDQILYGHVESIASGIVDRDNPAGDTLLHNVNPVFTWVRLAQRIPVRIALDPVRPGIQLVSGMTCTISLTPRDKAQGAAP